MRTSTFALLLLTAVSCYTSAVAVDTEVSPRRILGQSATQENDEHYIQEQLEAELDQMDDEVDQIVTNLMQERLVFERGRSSQLPKTSHGSWVLNLLRLTVAALVLLAPLVLHAGVAPSFASMQQHAELGVASISGLFSKSGQISRVDGGGHIGRFLSASDSIPLEAVAAWTSDAQFVSADIGTDEGTSRLQRDAKVLFADGDASPERREAEFRLAEDEMVALTQDLRIQRGAKVLLAGEQDASATVGVSRLQRNAKVLLANEDASDVPEAAKIDQDLSALAEASRLQRNAKVLFGSEEESPPGASMEMPSLAEITAIAQGERLQRSARMLIVGASLE